ncbi:MFS transporter [Catelliglobosispora koreensis]|uniref:MFS transporter n=1 Tax=Catelliglobosispora koreensis TaxID=129052 RepID=UPI000377DD70
MRRYVVALAVDSVGGGMLRPFLVLYGVTVLGLGVGEAGVALSAGLLAGLAALPLLGRWIDRGVRSAAVAATLFIRVAGIAVLLTGRGFAAFAVASVLLGVGSQAFPAAHAAVVAALKQGRERDAALATTRSVRNAGLGAGALLGLLAVAGGGNVLKVLIAATALAFLVAGGLTLSTRVTAGRPKHDGRQGTAPSMAVLLVANLPFAMCFSVLEVVLPALLATRMQANAAWPAALFVGNTVLVIVLQVPLVRWLSKWARGTVFAASGVVLGLSYLGFWVGEAAGAVAIAAVGVIYTLGEILYTGSGTALVIASTPPAQLGRALVRFQLSTGLGMAIAPAALLGLLEVGPAALWGSLSVATFAAALAFRWKPVVRSRWSLSAAGDEVPFAADDRLKVDLVVVAQDDTGPVKVAVDRPVGRLARRAAAVAE